MGFPSVCFCVILPQPLILVLQLFDLLRHAVLLCLSSLGLGSPPPADDHPAHAAPAAAADLWALQAAAVAPPAAVKALLPAVRYADLLRSRRGAAASPAVCAVCLGALEARHRVRELGNCAHAFHKACIDKWVDKGQATCPLCRAALLPATDDLALFLLLTSPSPAGESPNRSQAAPPPRLYQSREARSVSSTTTTPCPCSSSYYYCLGEFVSPNHGSVLLSWKK